MFFVVVVVMNVVVNVDCWGFWSNSIHQWFFQNWILPFFHIHSFIPCLFVCLFVFPSSIASPFPHFPGALLNPTLLPPTHASQTLEPIVGKPLFTPNPCFLFSPSISFHREQVFPPSDLVYLSPDASDPLLSIDPQKVYVIGGFIDRSVNKVGFAFDSVDFIESKCDACFWIGSFVVSPADQRVLSGVHSSQFAFLCIFLLTFQFWMSTQ